MLYHFTTRYDEKLVHTTPLPLALDWGHVGVQLFFVISGFVIFMTLDRSRSASDFVVSRFSRLYPTYWASVAVTWIVLYLAAVPGAARTWADLAANLTMVHGLFEIRSIDGVYWSLEIELLFYVWMLGIASALRTRESMTWLHCWLMLALLHAVAQTQLGRGAPYLVAHIGLLDWIPWFALGIACYAAHVRGRWTLQCIGTVAIAIAAIWVARGWAYVALAIVCTLLVYAGAAARLRLMGSPVLVWLGAVSYPLYLTHQEIGYTLIQTLESHGLSPLTAVALAIVATLLLAQILRRAVEQPAMAWIREHWRSRTPSVVSTGSGSGGIPRSAVATGLCAILIGVLFAGSVVLGGRVRADARARFNALELVGSPAPQASVACPVDARSRPTLLVLGQSNAASQVAMVPDGSLTLVHSTRGCGVWTDPLPNTTGQGASIWSALAAMMRIESVDIEPVIAPLAVGGTSVMQWTQDGRMRAMFLQHLDTLRAQGIKPKAVLWQQGEADMRLGTSASQYIEGIARIRADLDAAGIGAPLIVARSTYCRGAGTGAIGRAIDRFIATGGMQGVEPGPDTDSIGPAFRADGCHFSAEGRQMAARAWLPHVMRILAAPTAGLTTTAAGPVSPAAPGPDPAAR